MRNLICTMTLLLAFTLSAPAGDDNAAKNGDFEKGKMGWKTEPGVHVIDITDAGKPAKVLETELDKNDTRKLSTRIDIKSKTKALLVSFRMKPGPNFKSATPDGDQFTLRMERPHGGSTFSGRKIKPGNEWQNYTWDFSTFEGARTFTFSIEFHAGEGALWVDDVVVKEL